MLRVIVVLVVGLHAGACALIPETVDIRSKSANGSSQEGAGAMVDLRTVDGRITHRDRVATKKNGVGVELASIKSSRSL
jgi:hypothetical protein